MIPRIRNGTGDRDRRFLLWLSAAVLLITIVVSIVAPARAGNDPRPSSWNSAPGGTKGLYLALESLGRPVARWDKPLDDLDTIDAADTTLVVLEPRYSALEHDRLLGALQGFMNRGGRVLTTGVTGALLIPDGAATTSRLLRPLCYTRPEGPGPLARVGEVETYDFVRWGTETPTVRVDQRCGPDAVVIHEPVGRGEAIWWSSAAPITNLELHNDADLQLTLLSLGKGRRVLFDESLQQAVRSKWSAAQGLPLRWLLGQAALVFGLLVFSFSRRRGPVRLPVTVPRSSPVEFAYNMGDLYERAGATGAATSAAQRRLEQALGRDGGLPRATIQAGPDPVAEALTIKFGGDWKALAGHLREAVETAGVHGKPRSALRLVQALGEDARRVREAARQPGTGAPAIPAPDAVPATVTGYIGDQPRAPVAAALGASGGRDGG